MQKLKNGDTVRAWVNPGTALVGKIVGLCSNSERWFVYFEEEYNRAYPFQVVMISDDNVKKLNL